MSTIFKTIRQIGFLTIALTLALGANLAYSQWANPTAAPTGNNATAPINIGGDLQNKLGDMGAFTVSASDEMRSDLYCDYAGTNCFAATTTAALVNGGGGAGGGITFIEPVVLYTGSGNGVSGSFDLTPHIPMGANGAIIDGEYALNGPDGGDIDSHVTLGDAMTSQSQYLLFRGRCGGSRDACAGAGQGFFPVSSDGKLYYSSQSPGFAQGLTLRLVGYY